MNPKKISANPNVARADGLNTLFNPRIQRRIVSNKF